MKPLQACRQLPRQRSPALSWQDGNNAAFIGPPLQASLSPPRASGCAKRRPPRTRRPHRTPGACLNAPPAQATQSRSQFPSFSKTKSHLGSPPEVGPRRDRPLKSPLKRPGRSVTESRLGGGSGRKTTRLSEIHILTLGCEPRGSQVLSPHFPPATRSPSYEAKGPVCRAFPPPATPPCQLRSAPLPEGCPPAWSLLPLPSAASNGGGGRGARRLREPHGARRCSRSSYLSAREAGGKSGTPARLTEAPAPAAPAATAAANEKAERAPA